MKAINSFKKGMAMALSAALMLGLVPVMPGSALKVQAAGDNSGADTTMSEVALGTGIIANPTAPTDADSEWKGSYVYFGTYDGNPVKYRVLDSETSVFGGTTMLLDCDSVLWAGSDPSSAFDADSNVWADSDIRTYLNGTFLANNFSTLEQNAIASSTKSAADSNDGDGRNGLSYASLSNDKIFFLDAKEATNTSYGYSNTYLSATNRVKTGGNDFWWLRSACTDDSFFAGYVNSGGYIYDSYVIGSSVGVSPALNVNLSSVLFTSASGTSKSSALAASSSPIGTTTGTEWKLTLADTGKTIKVTDNEVVSKAVNGTITVPYTYTDTATADAEKVNQISVMITDKSYTESDAAILYYGALQGVDISATTGTGTFVMPSGLDGKVLGTDYHLYILAEHTTGTNATDYASAPVEIAVMYNAIGTVEASIHKPVGGQALSTDITCTADGVESATLLWTDTVNQPVDAIANYYPWTYKAHITITPETGYVFTSNTQITVNGTVLADEKSVNADGTITVTGDFESSKAKLISITDPQSIRVANGTAYASMNLPTEVNIETEKGAATTAAVSWDTTTPASGSYDRTVLTEQTVTLNGTVTCPEEIDANGVALTTTITITIEAAGITGAPSITTQPGNEAVKVGGTATFTIAASGTDLTYQWQMDRNDGNGWVNIAGATATSYTTSTVDISCNGFKYQCVVSNSVGTVTSNTAVLTVTGNTNPDPEPTDYDIMDGANSSWTQNSDGSLSIRGSGAFSKFVGVKVDGTLVDTKNYTVKEGSTIVTLKTDYLNILSVGTHTFEILWTDGTASTTFTIKADTSDDGNNNRMDDVPKTGDDTPVAWLFILSILSGAGFIITAKKHRINLNSSKR